MQIPTIYEDLISKPFTAALPSFPLSCPLLFLFMLVLYSTHSSTGSEDPKPIVPARKLALGDEVIPSSAVSYLTPSEQQALRLAGNQMSALVILSATKRREGPREAKVGAPCDLVG